MTALIELRNVQKTFDRLPVIDNISECIASGEIISLVGPSGCGKSTLLRLIAGTELPDGGKITCRVTPDKIGFIFQDARLLPWRSALQNVLFVLKNRIANPNEREARARDALQRVGLADFANYPPAKLSGGMQKRVTIARALAIQADLLLFDEPFSDLDLPLRMTLIQDIQKLLRDGSKTAIYVTHDIREALILSDRVLVLAARPTWVKEVITLTKAERSNGMLSPELLAIEANVIASLSAEARQRMAAVS
jgi:NitT/TauT family transport system ATP-binding protein